MKHCEHNDEVLKVSELDVWIDEVEILSGVNLSVKRGEVCAIVGRNGAGKTVLLKAILGLMPVKKGVVRVLGREVAEVLGRIGYVPQKFEFDRTFPLSIDEFLGISCGIEDKEAKRRRIEHVLREVDMLDERKKLIGKLSGGQTQRVLIARALLNDPQVLFLDEPTTGIDSAGQKSFFEVIDHLNKVHNVTVVMISHEAEVVKKYANQIFHVGIV